MNNTNTYKLICETVDLVVQVKVLTTQEEQDLYVQIREKISKSESAFIFHEYKEFLAKKLVVGFDSIIEDHTEGKESESYALIMNSLYAAVTTAYPPLSLDFVCTDLNTEKYMQNTNEDPAEFLKNLTASLKAKLTAQNETVKQKQKKKNSTPTIKNNEAFKKFESELKTKIIGQDHAIEGVMRHLKLISAGLSTFSSFFFVGPTGVGKTELARLLGERFSGHFFKINCSEYAGAHEYAKLIGSPPGYVGHTDKSILKEKADKTNKWVFLFDEIEKADPKFQDFLLSLLDDGTCTDNMGNILDFSQSLFIFTSNQGVSDIKYQTIGFGKESPTKNAIQSTILDSIKKRFSPEFMNRIDDVIFFNSLTKTDVRDIVKLKLATFPVEITEDLVDYVIENSYSFEYGARNVARYIKNNIAPLLAETMLMSECKKKEVYRVLFSEGKPKVYRKKTNEEKDSKKGKDKILEVHVGGKDTVTSKNVSG
jgi:ATP-dependent Clp protease ATP-binding subunit ClpC